MFVPFYLIYWVYQSARRIDRLAASRGVSNDLTVLCLILAIFVGIIPPMLMQEKLNAIIDIETGGAGRQPSFHQNSEQSGRFSADVGYIRQLHRLCTCFERNDRRAQTASGSPDFGELRTALRILSRLRRKSPQTLRAKIEVWISQKN